MSCSSISRSAISAGVGGSGCGSPASRSWGVSACGVPTGSLEASAATGAFYTDDERPVHGLSLTAWSYPSGCLRGLVKKNKKLVVQLRELLLQKLLPLKERGIVCR